MNLYILKYNNYYNRQVKKFDTLSKYLVEPYYDGQVIENIVNFNPNDNVNTFQTINTNYSGDYAILAESDQIISRWFIIEGNRLANGQWKLQLRRDLVADNYNEVINAPCFIEKATLNNTDPLIFNNENMSFNQIKTSETLLKDSLACPWIVGYATSDLKMSEAGTITVKAPAYYGIVSDFESLWNTSKGPDNNVRFSDSTKFQYRIDGTYSPVAEASFQYTYLFSKSLMNETQNGEQSVLQELRTKVNTFDSTSLTYFNVTANKNQILNYSGKILKGANDTYYKVNITSKTKRLKQTPAGSLKTLFENTTNNISWFNGQPFRTYQVEVDGTIYSYSLEQVYGEGINYQIGTHATLSDAPYSMFAIPFGAVKIKCGNTTITLSEQQAKDIASTVSSDLIRRFGGNSPSLYDIQILPYNPFQDYVQADNSLLFTDSSNYTELKDNKNTSTIKGFILWANNSRFQFTIPYLINSNDPKIENECDLYRLVSPNFNGQFEFSAAKNGGVDNFTVDCEYKPFQPYIHINPNFGWLYGDNFGDARGLICSGEFSLSQISDAWETYKRNNANYENIFNRQIENMQFNNRLSNIQSLIGGGASALRAGVSAGMIGGPIAGATAGALSLIGAGADYGINRALQSEALDYTKDMYGYNIGNIKALPNSLTKVSALNPNNKIFPILEYYTCTDTEKQALKDKLKYNGMTVMKIGKIVDYIKPEPSYIKGKIIRMENLHEDTNYVNELANEINKGVFI